MSAFLLGWFRWIWLFTRGHQALVLENLALRQQLAVYKRHSKRPRLRRSDRLFWIVLAGLWKGWRRALVQVHPDTVVRWQRQRFRRYWAQLSCKPRRKVGRPSIGKPIRNLIQTMARANSLWRAPRIHGELLKLGIKISERTVSRILRTVKRPPSQTWKTFLQNPYGQKNRTDCKGEACSLDLYMLLRFQKAAVRGNYETGNQAFSKRLRFLTIRHHRSPSVKFAEVL